MALRCAPGDLAVILRGEASGVFVDVLARAPDQPVTGWPSWVCRVKADVPCTLVAHDKLGQKAPRIVRETTVHAGGTVCLPDNNLQPIRPPKKATPAPPQELELEQ